MGATMRVGEMAAFGVELGFRCGFLVGEVVPDAVEALGELRPRGDDPRATVGPFAAAVPQSREVPRRLMERPEDPVAVAIEHLQAVDVLFGEN